MATPEYDVVFAGAGFGTICTLNRFRKLGLKCHIVEKGARSGGIWYWNCYPGARVDSDAPIYQMFDKEFWEGFSFTERYPGWQELRRYFDYLDEKMDFSKDTDYNTTVEGARWDESSRKWTINCANGKTYTARWFIPAIGFAAKAYIPNLPGLDKFKGPVHHTAYWPQEGINLKKKRIAVIGTGASGIQCIQELAPESTQLTTYQRTPNLCLPMNQRPINQEINKKLKADGSFHRDMDMTQDTFAGFQYDFKTKNTFDDPPEVRQQVFRNLMVEEGGFRYWLAGYKDLFFDEAANREAYDFWRDFTRARINDPRKREILAPMEPPHPWGTKRPSLEQYYYECYNLDHVDVVDIEKDPMVEITETGIRTKSGDTREFDAIVLATGFDAVTGSLGQLDIQSSNGQTIKQHWEGGLKTAMGVAINSFPNMFILYGPQAPTAFSNGPSCVQWQARWLDQAMQKILANKVTRFEAKQEVEDEWADRCQKLWDASLFRKAKGWYNGANIPGKKVEALNWTGGMGLYISELNKSLENDFQAWHTAST